MIFTLTDRMYNVLDAYETDDYLIGQYVGSILETLDINVLTKSIHADLWTRGNYIMCQDKKGRKYWFTIYDDEDGLNDDVKSFSCYSGTIDIVSEEYPPISATQAQPFDWYFNRIFSDTGITLGINEISGLSRKLEFTSENATNAEMLQFVLNGFDNAEAQLDVKFDGSTPTELVLNVYKRLGEEQPQALLSDEDDSLTDLTRKGSLSELGTCLDLQGAEVDEKTITLAGKYYEEKDAAGNILYYSPKNLTRIFSVKAHEDYYVKLPGKANGEFDGYINRRYKSEAKTQDALWSEGLAQLKKIDHAIVEYDAKGDINCGIGDNVQVISHTMRPPVMVSARATEYKFNDDDRSRNEYKFSNYVDLESNMEDLTSIINKIKDQIVYIKEQTVEYCLAEQGVTAPTTGWTNVNPGAIKGKWLWVRTTINYSNGTSSVSEVPTYSAINGEAGVSPIVTPNDDGTITILDVEGEKVTPDLTGPAGDDGRGITGTPSTTYAKSTSGTTPPTTWSATRPSVPAGQYLWTKVTTRYTDDTESATIIPTLMGPKGDAGLGIKDKAVEYAKGTSGTTPPTSGWSTTIPTVGANEYQWTRTVLTYTDNSTTVAYNVGKMGANGQDAQLLYLTATAENVAFNADDTPKTAQTITISAKLQNVTGTATFTAIPYIGNTAQSAISLGGSGNNRTLATSQWTNKAWTLIAITAKLGNLDDTLSVVKVKDGAPGEVDQETIDAITAAAEDAKQAGEAAQEAAEKAEADSATALSNANNAVNKANDASTKADQSQLTANQAKSDAVNALANANDALDTAGTANATSNQAKSDAAGAISLAQEAGQNANTALSNANQAIGDASNALAQSALAKSQAEEAINKYLGIGMSPAWSWSADGTDRFTTIYPGENLLAGTSDYSYGIKGANTVVLTGDDGYNGHAVIKTTISPTDLSYIDSWTYRVPEALKAGTYTLSFKAKASIDGASISSYFYNPNTTTSAENSQGFKSSTNDGTSLFTLTTEWETYWITWKQRETASPKQAVLARIRRGDVPLDVYITEPKFESGINHDYIYTPASSEDYENAVPSYIGFAIEPSDNPADYTWMRNPEKVEGEVKVELTEINGELSRKVSQESFDQLNGTVTNQSTLISQNQKDIQAKADQTLVDTINKTVTDNSAAIDLNSKSIALKANQSTVDSLTGRVTTAEGSITTIAGQVDLKANKTDVDTIAGRVTSAESQLTVQGGRITGLSTLTDGHTTQIGSLQSGYDGLSSTVSKVESDLDGLEIGGRNYFRHQDIVNLAIGGTILAASIYRGWYMAVKAGETYSIQRFGQTNNRFCYVFTETEPGPGVPWIAGNYPSQSLVEKAENIKIPEGANYIFIYLSNQASEIPNIKVEKGSRATDWTPAPEDMATVNEMSSLTQTVNTIQSTVANKADKTQVTQLANQWQQTTDLANGHTSQISSLGDAVNIRVEKGDVINQINVSPESILIAGSKVHITGQTTIDSAVVGTAQIKDAAITDAKISSLSANKVTFGTLDGLKANIINIDAKNILADTFTGFVFQGVEFIGSRFVNEWTDSQSSRSGRTKIEEGEYTTGYWASGSKDENLTAGGEFRISKDGILTNNWKDTTVNKSQGYVLNDQFLEFFSNGRSDITFTGRLTAETLSQMNLMHTRVSEVIRYPGATDVITPSMALDKTYTGWMLEFCGMMNGTPTEGDLCYVIVPKFLKDKSQPVIMSPRITVHGGADSRKILYITNTTITGHANNAAAPSNGAVLRRVYVI